VHDRDGVVSIVHVYPGRKAMNAIDTIRMPMLGAACVATLALAARGASSAPLHDAEIVERVLTFARGEKQLADTVKGILSSPGPWGLALRLSVDYGDLDRGFASAADRERAYDGAAGRQVVGAELSGLSGDAVDKAYVSREVKSHEAMLAELDRQLIPDAGEDLRRRLFGVRSDIAAHLLHARSIQQAQWRSDAAVHERQAISREIGN